MEKWANANEFHKATHGLDIAYDGAFSVSQTHYLCALMAEVKPGWIFLDDEAFGAGWETWRVDVVS